MMAGTPLVQGLSFTEQVQAEVVLELLPFLRVEPTGVVGHVQPEDRQAAPGDVENAEVPQVLIHDVVSFDPWSWLAASPWRCHRAGAAFSPVTRRRPRLPHPGRRL